MEYPTRVLRAIALLLTASAASIIFVAVPGEWLDTHHMLPGNTGYLLFLFAPFLIAWDRAGMLLLLIVTLFAVSHVLSKPGDRRAKVEAVAMVAICTSTYLYIYASKRFHFN